MPQPEHALFFACSVDLSSMLIESLNLSQGITGQKRDFYFSPSKAGVCPRAMYFEFFNVEPEDTNQHVFEDGKIHEDLTIQFLSLSDDVEIYDRQKPVNIKIPKKYENRITMLINGKCPVCGEDVFNALHGHVDGIFRIKNKNQKIVGVFEHKAVNDATVKKYKRQGIWRGYLEQLALYCRGLGLNCGVVLVKNKNNATYLEAETKYDLEKDTLYLIRQTDSFGNTMEFNLAFPMITEKIFERFAFVEQNLKEGKIPEVNEQFMQFCHSCSYRRHCEEILAQEVENKIVDFSELNDKDKKYLLEHLNRYFVLSEQRDVIESEIEESKNKILNFLMSKKVKSVRIQNVPIFFSAFNKTYYNFDVEKLKKKLSEEDFADCLVSMKEVYVQSMYIPPRKKAFLSEIVKSLLTEKKTKTRNNLLSR